MNAVQMAVPALLYPVAVTLTVAPVGFCAYVIKLIPVPAATADVRPVTVYKNVVKS